MKKYVLIILLFLLATILVGVYTVFNGEETTTGSQVSSPQSAVKSAYQDVQWGLNVQKNFRILKSDLDNISSATNRSDLNALAEAAQAEIDDTQKAIEENDQYRVSPKLQEPQKEWRAALQDYNTAGKFLLEGANAAKSGRNGSGSFQKAATLSSSGTVHLKKASEALGLNVSLT